MVFPRAWGSVHSALFIPLDLLYKLWTIRENWRKKFFSPLSELESWGGVWALGLEMMIKLSLRPIGFFFFFSFCYRYLPRRDHAPLSSVPFAFWYIPSFMGNLFMMMLFTVTDPLLAFIWAAYTSWNFYDTVLILEGHWDIIVEAIEEGKIPDVYDLDYCRPYLEVEIFIPSRIRCWTDCPSTGSY